MRNSKPDAPVPGFASAAERDAELQEVAQEMGVAPERLKRAVQAAPFNARAQKRMLAGKKDRRFKL